MQVFGEKLVQNALGKWSPTDVAYICGLNLKPQSDSSQTILHLEVLLQSRTNEAWPNINDVMYTAQLKFEEVTDLTIRNFGGCWNQVMGFDILCEDSADSSNKICRVIDYEDDRISFQFRRYSIESIERLNPS